MNSLNYLSIVLEGYFRKENRQYLDNYFYRVFKQSERQYFEIDEFFNGCLGIIDSLNNEIQRQVSKYVMETNKALMQAEKNGDKKQVESIVKQLEDIHPDGVGNISFAINMMHFTNGKIAHHMTYDEVQSIKLHILKAYKKVKTEKLKESLLVSVKEIKTQSDLRQQKLKTLTNNTKLAGLKSDNIEEYFKEKYHKWLFDNSDTTFIDDELHSQVKDTPTKTEGQNIFLDVSFFSTIRPQPKKIEVSGTKQGHKLSEQKFISHEIRRVKKIDDDLLSDVKQWNREDYLEFLTKKSAYNQPDKIEPKYDYFIIAEMLATNQIVVEENLFVYESKKYEHGYSLNKAINEAKDYNPPKTFTQYLNDWRSKTGEKYLLDNKDTKSIKRLRKIKEYFQSNKVEVKNKDFILSFKDI